MEEKLKKLKNILGERARENEMLARYTTFKIGGPADLFFEAKTVEELVLSVTQVRKLSLPLFVLGGGSNILIGDKGFRGVVIKNNTQKISIKGIKGNFKAGRGEGTVFVEAESGVIMNKLVRFTIEEGLGDLEMHLGLPGTVGGALFMNSKWTKPEGYVGDVLYQATILTPAGILKIVPKTYFHFGYDRSILQKSGDLVLTAVFALISKSKTVIWETANNSIAYRRQSQPQGVFSPGCTFKNITKSQALAIPTPNYTTSAGFLLDHAGVKSMRVGEAQISPVHANFIVNLGHASAADVVELIDLVRDQVKKKFGVDLQEEIVRVGEF